VSEYQKCPRCDGSGRLMKPPWVAGDQHEWSSTGVGPYTCPTCAGTGLLVRPIGDDPVAE
jgi:DnaJ-class molecular chaperone